MKHNRVPHHTFKEVLPLSGNQQPMEGLYIITTEEEPAENIISYAHRSDHFIIVLIKAGEACIKINLADYSIRANGILMIPPNAIRQFPEMSPDLQVAGIVFTSEFLSQAGMNMKHIEMLDFFSSNNTPYLEAAPTDINRLLLLLHILHQKSKTSATVFPDNMVISHCFLAFLYEVGAIHAKYSNNKKITLSRKEAIAMRFSKLLVDHFKEERSVLFYAEQLTVTPRYLTQTVKEVTGQSAGELIDEMVILEAKALLNNLSMSIAQVSEKLYFSDQFFFSKYFKRHTGLTPSEYRKSS